MLETEGPERPDTEIPAESPPAETETEAPPEGPETETPAKVPEESPVEEPTEHSEPFVEQPHPPRTET